MKEEEIRPQKVMVKQKEVYMEDVKNLLKRKKEFVEVNCPACESNDYKKSLEVKEKEVIRLERVILFKKNILPLSYATYGGG